MAKVSRNTRDGGRNSVELSRRRHLEPIVPRNFRVVLGPQPLAIVLGCGGKCVCQSRRWEKLGSKGQGEGDSNESSLSRWVGVTCEIFHLHCDQQAGGDGFGGAALTPSNLYSPSVELTHFLDQPSRKGSKNTTCRGRGVTNVQVGAIRKVLRAMFQRPLELHSSRTSASHPEWIPSLSPPHAHFASCCVTTSSSPTRLG
jgi:hypothetical protein